MEKKGLCQTCVQNKECIFPKEPSVWQCEEFSDYGTNHAETKHLKQKTATAAQEAVSCEE